MNIADYNFINYMCECEVYLIGETTMGKYFSGRSACVSSSSTLVISREFCLLLAISSAMMREASKEMMVCAKDMITIMVATITAEEEIAKVLLFKNLPERCNFLIKERLFFSILCTEPEFFGGGSVFELICLLYKFCTCVFVHKGDVPVTKRKTLGINELAVS